jgi:hypothetical protein
MVNITRDIVGHIRRGDMRCESSLGSYRNTRTGRIDNSGNQEQQCSHRACYIVQEHALCRGHAGDQLINYHLKEPDVKIKEEFEEIKGVVTAVTHKGIQIEIEGEKREWFPTSQILNASAIQDSDGEITAMISKWLMNKRREEGREV